MKKFYYFSEKHLKFVEIKSFKGKISIFFSIAVLIVSSLIISGFFLLSNFYSSDGEVSALRLENKALKNKLLDLSTDYSKIQKELADLSELSNDLRLALNLTPLSEEEKKLGIGGSSNELSMDFFKLGSNLELTDALNYVDKIAREFEFEKSQYLELSEQLKENQNLYQSLPAILPTVGDYSKGNFGIRLHPILGKYRMHNGIDIVTDVGTPVYSPGNGEVIFVGRRGGYGLIIEIDHGFGYTTVYAHLSKTLVKKGKKVNRGDMIGKTGNSGLSSGPHLHYEVHHNGIAQDPMEFFFDDFGYFDTKNN